MEHSYVASVSLLFILTFVSVLVLLIFPLPYKLYFPVSVCLVSLYLLPDSGDFPLLGAWYFVLLETF